MFDDDERTNEPKGQRLEEMSIEALRLHIDALKQEISDWEALITNKQSTQSEADALFKR